MHLTYMNYCALTGGWSSVFSPRSGFAFRFANTPSFEEANRVPPLGVRVTTEGITGAGAGSWVTVLWTTGLSPWFETEVGGEALPRISRWRSSPSLSSSVSEHAPSSNVSANVLSASEVRGSSEESRCLEVGDEARDRKDGGGDEGIGGGGWSLCGDSMWSLSDICTNHQPMVSKLSTQYILIVKAYTFVALRHYDASSVLRTRPLVGRLQQCKFWVGFAI